MIVCESWEERKVYRSADQWEEYVKGLKSRKKTRLDDGKWNSQYPNGHVLIKTK